MLSVNAYRSLLPCHIFEISGHRDIFCLDSLSHSQFFCLQIPDKAQCLDITAEVYFPIRGEVCRDCAEKVLGFNVAKEYGKAQRHCRINFQGIFLKHPD